MRTFLLFVAASGLLGQGCASGGACAVTPQAAPAPADKTQAPAERTAKRRMTAARAGGFGAVAPFVP